MMLSWCQICWFPRYQFGPRADQDQLFQLFLLQSDFLWVYAAPVVSVWKKLHFLAIWYHLIQHTAVQGRLKWQKKFRSISRLPQERPYPELRNEPPLDSLEKPVPNPLLASLWIGSGAGWPLKGLGLASPDHQVGAHFEALDKGVLMAASKSI